VSEATRKDLAEFFRLALRTGVCGLSDAVQWADRVIGAEHAPADCFLDLSLCTSTIKAVTLLEEAPGQPTPDLALYLLLGHSARLVRKGLLAPATALRRLQVLTTWESVPESLALDLMRFDDGLDLARMGVYGTEAEVAREFAAFLGEFEEWAPEV
jgi:hypothetical protein